MTSSIAAAEDSSCIVCQQPAQDDEVLQCLHTTGALAVERHSRGTIKANGGHKVHKRCRDHLRRKYVLETKPTFEEHCARTTRSMESYDFKTRCLFCGHGDRSKGREKEHELIVSRTLESDDTLLDKCAERQDEWASRVQGILSFVPDLHSADAVYHHRCRTNFLTGKKDFPGIFHDTDSKKRGRPQKGSSTVNKKGPGRPKNNEQQQAFELVVAELESDTSKQWSLVEVQNLWAKKMSEFGSFAEPMSTKTIKNMLLERLGEDISISSSDGQPDIVIFMRQQDAIIRQFYKQSRETDPVKEKLRILNTAGALVFDDIMAKENPYINSYPSVQDILSSEVALEFIPPSLKLFLSKLISSVKAPTIIASLGQAIMQAARPRSLLAPLQFGLAIQMNHHFASRYLNDTLYSHGFASSYDCVQDFRRAATVSPSSSIGLLTEGEFGTGIDFVGDNVDHNQVTIDGRNTLHAMGVMVVCTPAMTKVEKIPRRRRVTAEEVKGVAKVSIKSLPGPCTGLSKKVFPSLKCPDLRMMDGAQLL